jgi:hypothetical protein
MRRGAIASLLAWVLGFALPVFAESINSDYIRDIEGLLANVESRDPSRPQLVLKLADAVFNEALELGRQPALAGAEQGKLAALRRRAVGHYQDALSGLSGMFPVPGPLAAGKIKFQLARLQADLGQTQIAEKIWRELSTFDSMPDVQRESLLRLAETAENRGTKESLFSAETDYKKAIALCGGQDVCSYGHYRMAWVHYRQERLPEAIQEMTAALWDSKGQVREESLRDLIAFLGGMKDDGKDSLPMIEKLAAKLNRPNLVFDLSQSYFARGNRQGGVFVLEAANQKQPGIKSYVRLMEESYGFREWLKFASLLDSAFSFAGKTKPATIDNETEQILRRLTVQLDGERVSQPPRAEDFKRAVMLYLALFPERQERKQMIDGWLAAETDAAAKVTQLKIWIAEETAAGRGAEAVRLRNMRAGTAQTARMFEIVIEELTELKKQIPAGPKAREMEYQIAYAHYQKKDQAAALPMFAALAAFDEQSAAMPDKWALQSEHLVLNILAESKDFGQVVKQAEAWTKHPKFGSWLANAKDQKDELADIQKIESSARFEWAVGLGQKPEALAVFKDYCDRDRQLPQSCTNAQVLAVKLKDQPVLISLLRKLGRQDELAAELEASAEFAEAAQILEKKLKDNVNKDNASVRNHLKVALLYELAASAVNRDRILRQMMGQLAAAKTLGEEENLILQTLKDAKLLGTPALKLPWRADNRDFITDYIVNQGAGTPDLTRQLAKTCRDTGPAWRKTAWHELNQLNSQQGKLQFYGKGSERKFKARVAALKALNDRANCYLEATSPRMRVVIGAMLAKASTNLAAEIQATPIPPEVDESGRESIQRALTEMAQPFTDQGATFIKLIDAQLAKIENSAERDELREKIAGAETDLTEAALAEPVKPAAASAKAEVASDGIQQAKAELHRDPNHKPSLTQLKAYYEANGDTRLAAYFAGRLQSGQESAP